MKEAERMDWKQVLKIFNGEGDYHYHVVRQAFSQIEELIKREIEREEKEVEK